jgi:hypothetical protein
MKIFYSKKPNKKAPIPATVWDRSHQQKDNLKGQTFMFIFYTKTVPKKGSSKQI